jgi:putative transposase
MSWVRIWVHLVFSTKNREAILHKDIRLEIFKYIKQNADEKDVWLDCVNGYSDHIHCLVSLNKDQSISKIAQLIKGESSHWINKNKMTKSKFNWQDDYWAVSDSHLESVRSYIYNQEVHHKRKSFSEEINYFMKKYGWQYLESK